MSRNRKPPDTKQPVSENPPLFPRESGSAMTRVFDVLEPLDNAARVRVLRCACIMLDMPDPMPDVGRTTIDQETTR